VADAEAAGELLAAYGIAARSRLVRTPAAAAQAELGGPAAVKIAAASHKSDVGGVALGVDSPRAAAAMASALGLCLGRAARCTPTGTR
jgi:acyl-CoA synthetase (NDP forming)